MHRSCQLRLFRLVGAMVVPAVGLLILAGCQQPTRKMVSYPPGNLLVPYERASGPSSCLVAATAMAANYLVGQHRFDEPRMLADMQKKGLNETSVAAVKVYLAGEGLYLLTLTGQDDDKPPAGLGYWLLKRGYPVVCVINKRGEDPAYNHAVVVTGFSRNGEDRSADIVYYLDPAAEQPLQAVGRAEFETLWTRGHHAMMIAVEPPDGADQRKTK